MNTQEFKRRTQQFALRIIHLVNALPTTLVACEIGRQLLRSGMSVGANYRAACRARSGNEFIAKMGIVEEECDETMYWMELLILTEIIPEHRLDVLMQEADEILAMVVTSITTRRSNLGKRT